MNKQQEREEGKRFKCLDYKLKKKKRGKKKLPTLQVLEVFLDCTRQIGLLAKKRQERIIICYF